MENYHKPLESIMKKPLYLTPPRLQRMLLSLQKYSFTLKYKEGKKLFVADTLSRDHLPDMDADDTDITVYMVSRLLMSSERLEELMQETTNDTTLTKLKKVILNEWPNDKSKLDPQVKPFWDYRDELLVEDLSTIVWVLMTVF